MLQRRSDFKLNITLCALLLVLISCSAELLRFDNYHVYELQPTTAAQVELLENLELSEAYYFLNGVHAVHTKFKVLVAPHILTEFLAKVEQVQLTYKLLDDNAQTMLDATKSAEPVADANRRTDDYSWEQYHMLNDTYNWLRQLEQKYPQQVTTFIAGSTYEKREILGVKISYGNAAKKGIFLESGIHAREWITPATTTFIINQLLTSSDKNVRMIAENYVWYIVPHTNPDGFVYTHEKNRMWRKTRSKQARNCFGADPNRNWDFHWGEIGASSNPCSETFAGTAAFSEVEIRSLANYIESLKQQLFLYVSLHSYSQLLLYPYGHTSELPANSAEFKRIFNVAVKSIRKRYGTRYTGGNIYDAIYPTSGTSIDWAYGVSNIKYTFCYELRPSSSNYWLGFHLPANQIIPTGEETLDSLIDLIKEADK